MRLSIVTTLSSLLFIACGSSPFVAGSGDGDAAVPTIEGGAPPPPPPGCDITKLPKEDACVLDESAGIFVSASLGNALGDGTRAKPFASIQAGIDFAKASKRRVYVCAETYKETIAFADGVSVFGDIDCSKGWKPSASRALVAAPSSPAAKAQGLASRTRIEALDIVAPDAGPSGNSIALVVALSPDFRLVDMRLHGGKAGAGADGANGLQLTDSGSAKNGANAYGDLTCNSNTFFCLGGPMTAGGTNQCMGKSITPQSGAQGGDPGHKASEYNQNISTYVWNWKSFSSAPNGGNGTGGTIGTDGKSGLGYFNVETLDFAVGDGTAGTDGGAGGGGLGGAGYYTAEPANANNYPGWQHWGIAGGAGGAGGCPGLAAAPGKGGGSSVGLVAFSSGITIEASTIESSDAGSGGKSGLPGVPTLGGSGGQGLSGALKGGDGGNGGFSGISGNGSGGHSFAIAANNGMAPTVDAKTTLTFGKAGAGVPKRQIDAFLIPASDDGKSGATYAF
jgi:hypothetical protein